SPQLCLRLSVEQAAEPRVSRGRTTHPAPIDLLELVALRARQEVGEVGEQVEALIEAVEERPRCGVVIGAVPLAVQPVILRGAAVARVERVKAIEARQVKGATCDLVGSVPVRRVGGSRYAVAPVRVAAAIAQHSIDLLESVGVIPRPIVME